MSKRFRRQLLRTFRDMAAEAYPGNQWPHDRAPIPKRPRQRWRRVIALHAKAQGWSFADAFVFERYREVFCGLPRGRAGGLA